MRKLLIAVVVLVLLGAGADFAAARIFEDRVTDALQREYDLGRRPVVQVRDFPFLPHLATGRFSTIDVAATDAKAKGVNAAQLQLTLHGVRVPREVMLGEGGRVTVERADGTLELTEAEVNRLLADRLEGGALELKDDGVEVSADLALVGQVQLKGKLGARDGGSPSPRTRSGWGTGAGSTRPPRTCSRTGSPSGCRSPSCRPGCAWSGSTPARARSCSAAGRPRWAWPPDC